MKCNYRYCNKEITYGRPDIKFCNKNCKSKENSIVKELKSLNRKITKSKEFVLKSQKVHNYKYNYDLVVYENCRTKVIIICPVHGMFEQTPNAHLYAGSGCQRCSRDSHRLTNLVDDRLNSIKILHNGKYQYNDLNVYNGYINIYCLEHGTFSQYLYLHESGSGCPTCNPPGKALLNR